MVEVEKQGITIRAIVLMALSTLIFSLISAYQGDSWVGGYHILAKEWNNFWHIKGGYVVGFGQMVIITLVSYLINRLRPGSLSRVEVTMMALAAPLTAIPFGYYQLDWPFYYLMPSGIFLLPTEQQAWVWDYLPPIFGGDAPADPRWDLMNGQPVIPRQMDYMVGVPMTLMHFTWTMLQWILMVGIALLIRYLWVQVEAFESPIANLSVDLVEGSQVSKGETSRKSVFSNKLFWIPFIIVAIYGWMWRGPVSLLVLLTGDLSWPINLPPWLNGVEELWGPVASIWDWEWDVNEMLNNPSLWTGMLVEMYPMDIGWATLLPQRVLIGVILGWLGYHVIYTNIEVSAGILPANAPTSNPGVWNARLALPSGESSGLLLIGMMWALLFVPVVLNWEGYKNILKGLYGKVDPNFDPDQPFSYRIVWLMVIVIAIILIPMAYFWHYLPMDRWTVYYFFMVILWLGIFRVICETGGVYGHLTGTRTELFKILGNWINNSGMVFSPIGPNENPSIYDVWAAGYIGPQRGYMNQQMYMVLAPGWYSIVSFQATDRQRSYLKNPALIAVVVVIGAFFIANLMHHALTWVIHPYHTMPFAGGVWDEESVWVSEDIPKYYEWVQTGLIWEPQLYQAGSFYGQIIVGFIIVTALLVLQNRITALQMFSVAGIVLGIWAGNYWIATAILGLAIRWISFRVGGLEFFEGKVKPIMLALVAGQFVGLFFMGWFNQWALIFRGWSIH
jgi:hypothetical protein